MAALPQITFADRGLVRTFGPFGPVYEVLEEAGRSAEGKELVQVRVVRTGEMLDHEVEQMLADPEAD